MAQTARSARRRSSDEIRRLILGAARELFARQGYDGTTTKEIAAQAGVLESLIFTNFGSKARLFDDAIVAPFADLVSDYVDAWERRSGESTPAERIEAFIDELFELALANRTLLRSALAGSAGGSGDLGPAAALLDHLAQTLHRIEGVSAIRRDYPEMDGPAAIGAIAGMVFGVALLDDMLYPAGTRKPAKVRLQAEMVRLVVASIAGHEPAASS
jgi:AcrR family transcriptional regulator